MPSRRPYDEVKSLIALILGLPILVGLVWLLLGYTNLVWGEFGIGVAALFLLVGMLTLAGIVLKSYALIQEAGGR